MHPRTAYGHELRHDRETVQASLRGAARTSFWLDDPARPDARGRLEGHHETDLLVVGGGYCGLWTALLAKERDPQRRVTLVEAHRIGWAASGRNGGFCERSLTHGPENGALHFADDLDAIERLAEENFRGLADTLDRYSIDAEWEETGMLTVATEPHQVEWMREAERERGTEIGRAHV